MTFRFATTTLDSLLSSAAVAVAAAAVLVTSKATAVTATDSDVVSFANSKYTNTNTNNDHFVTRNIAEGPSVGFDDFQHVGKEGIDLAATSTGTTRQLRNTHIVGDDGDASVGHNTIDIGILDAVNTKGVRTLQEIETVATIDHASDDYCGSTCGNRSNRPEIRAYKFQELLSHCTTNDCDCDGDGDIDYRCPSQFNCWITSVVTDMKDAFCDRKSFNQPLRCWDVSRVTDMSNMFDTASSFNQEINDWNVSSVSNMEGMFYHANDFDQSLDAWNTAKVTNMSRMFYRTNNFNQPLNSWSTSSVTFMSWMFQNSYEFNQTLDSWDVSSVENMRGMFSGATSFDGDIHSWNVSAVNNTRDMFDAACQFNQDISGWEVSLVADMSAMFRCRCVDRTCPPGMGKFNQDIGQWNVSSVMNTDNQFYFSSFNHSLQSWSVSSVQQMTKMFFKALDFNQPIDTWNVSSVTDMSGMFAFAKSFNQAVDVWDISSVLNMNATFSNATMFNQCLSTWASKNTIKSQPLSNVDLFNNSGCPVGGNDPDLEIGPWCQDSSNQCLKPCVDNPEFLLNGIEHKSCAWVAKQKTDERCTKPGVLAACSATCNPSCATTTLDCTDDTEFKLNGVKSKNCEWVAKQKTDGRCKKLGVMDSCRRTCNPSCGCRDSTDEFEIEGATITCEDLHISSCDEEVTSSDGFSDAQLVQLAGLFGPLLTRLDAIEDAVVEEDTVVEEVTAEPISTQTYGDLCPNKCRKCI